jgi:formate/nitrite transporter FocA (FNT family)
VVSLWWSGIAAGLALSTSVLAEAILYRVLAGSPAREAVAALGYALGFVLVILSRLQLFTENTLSVVLPVLARPSLDHMWRSARLWAVAFVANLVGTFVTAFISLKLGTTSPENTAAMLEVSRKVLEQTGWAGLTTILLAALAGNVIGGTGLFAFLAYERTEAENA